ncbi:MAG: hypothetical protein EOP33_03130 [Rickettsiaceae bacterium]|nr:MAG: hypothetical protein EOP33_03130 [Rickettsiaceae bacterium]
MNLILSIKLLKQLIIAFLSIWILVILIFQAQTESKKIVLWSWERYEDLSYIDTLTTAVAPLIATFIINDKEELYTKLRLNVYKIPLLTNVIPVFRIEMQSTNLNNKTVHQLVTEIISLSKTGQLIQLDFDVTLSQRNIYKEIINQLVNYNREVSITALASLCTYDSWLDSLPIKFAVPMLYNIKDNDRGLKESKALFARLGHWRTKKCQGYIGILRSDIIEVNSSHTLFIFNNSAWTKDHYNEINKHE